MIDTNDIFRIVLVTLAVFTTGAFVGSSISRYYVKKIFEAVKILTDAIVLATDKDADNVNIEALVDFNVASLVWHLSKEGSVAEAEALEVSAKAMARMDNDVRGLTMKGIDQAKAILDKAKADDEAEEAKAEVPADVH